MNNNYLKEVVYVDIGMPPGIPVGTVNEYMNLSVAETSSIGVTCGLQKKITYKRIYRDARSGISIDSLCI